MADAAALSVALEEETDRRGWSACHPSMVITPPVLGPVSRLRVPGESTTVLSDSWLFDAFEDDDDDDDEEEEDEEED